MLLVQCVCQRKAKEIKKKKSTYFRISVACMLTDIQFMPAVRQLMLTTYLDNTLLKFHLCIALVNPMWNPASN